MNVVTFPTAVQDPRIVTLLISVAKTTRGLVSLRLAEIGLSPVEAQIIMCADVRKPVEAGDLAGSLGIRFSTLQRSVEHLVALGRLERRGVFVKLTREGELLVPRILTARASIADDINASLGMEVVERMVGSLELLDNGLRRLLMPTA